MNLFKWFCKKFFCKIVFHWFLRCGIINIYINYTHIGIRKESGIFILIKHIMVNKHVIGSRRKASTRHWRFLWQKRNTKEMIEKKSNRTFRKRKEGFLLFENLEILHVIAVLQEEKEANKHFSSVRASNHVVS